MPDRIFNFSAGPATLPYEVLTQASKDIVNFKDTGMGLIEMSHRSKEFIAVTDEAEALLREIMDIPDNYKVLFLQGGASTQFALVAMNLLSPGQTACYLNTGTWSKKAIKEAKLFGNVQVGYSSETSNFNRVPTQNDYEVAPEAQYLYFVSNNTIFGTQFQDMPQTDKPLVCDMSSDILSRKIDVSKFGLIFAGAQKNMGPAGVTVVIIREDMIGRSKNFLPTMFNYKTHADKGSMFNTPPCFSIYVVGLVLKWLRDLGGMPEIEKRNREKAALLYNRIDATDFYRGHAEQGSRSNMNVTFNLPTPELEASFAEQATARGLSGLKFFNVKDSLELIIDRDVGQVIENTKINENLRNTIVVSDLLINTFAEREDTLTQEKDRLIDNIKADIRSLKLAETTSKNIFQEYIEKLNKLFDQCAAINGILKEINTTEKSLDIELSILDEIVVEKELTVAVEDSEEAESIKQLAIMLPGYREIFFEIIFEFINMKHAHLETNEINQKREQKILSLLEEFDIGLSAMPIAWKEIIPYVRNLMELTSRYKFQIAKIFKSMRDFHDQLGVLKLIEQQVVAETSMINNQIIKNTYAIRRDTSKNITSSIKTTIFLSSIIILILGVLGVFTVRLVQPIKRLSIGAEKIGAGDLNFNVKIDSNDEIGHLAESFNRMTYHLSETTVSKEYVQNILTSMNETLIVLSPQGHIQTVNQAACNLSGYKAEELVGESAAKFFGEIEGRNTTQKKLNHKSEIEKLVQQQFIKNNEKTFLGKDGREIPVLFSASAMLDKDGNVQGIVCVASDITERKRIEAELAAEKERLTVTLRSIGDGVISTDLQGRITSVNKVAEELTGWKEDEAIGKPLTKVFHIVDEFNRKRCEDPVRKVLETGAIVGLANNTILIGKDGNEHVIADSGAPIMNSQNQILGAVLVFRDITEKRKMEAELVNAQKLESLGVLAGGIAHDFNNFLTAIIGNLSLARIDSKPGDQVLVLLNEMEKASLQAKDLTQQLLTFSRGGEPVKKLVALAELVKNSTSFSLRGSNVRCKFSIAEDLLPVEVDEGQIGQVINNLVLNADHAMPEGGIIEICAENITLTADNKFSLPPGPYLRTSFRDNGVGIGPDHLSKVFDPYFTTKQKGSGLGLTVAYSIIDKHNGRLTVESELGHGTTFTIYLPASEKTATQPVAEEKRLFIGKGKILVMDDEEFIHEVAIQMLSKIGYEVSVAYDGDQAIDMYRQAQKEGEPFDIVIMDLTIPGGMGGKEAIQKLQKLDPNVKALVSSGYSNDPVMSNFKEYGFQGVVKKPYRIQDMSDALRSVVTVKTE